MDQKLRSNHDSAELEEMVQIVLLCIVYIPCHHPKLSKIVKMLEGGDGVEKKWEAIKNIEEPNPNWSSELVCISINYYEDQCNSIELQAIELLVTCVCACVFVYVCVCICVCCGGMYKIISLRLPAWEDKESVGMLQNFR